VLAVSLLVVDDEPLFPQLTAATLRPAGYRVRCARSGCEALRALGEGPFALVFVDHHLGGDDGLALIEEMAPRVTSRFVLWSAALTSDGASAARALGAQPTEKLTGPRLLALVTQLLDSNPQTPRPQPVPSVFWGHPNDERQS
jgi:CheY-like chemotaxis protein